MASQFVTKVGGEIAVGSLCMLGVLFVAHKVAAIEGGTEVGSTLRNLVWLALVGILLGGCMMLVGPFMAPLVAPDDRRNR